RVRIASGVNPQVLCQAICCSWSWALNDDLALPAGQIIRGLGSALGLVDVTVCGDQAVAQLRGQLTGGFDSLLIFGDPAGQ
ncbi:hypothetical protein, partial [Pseudomonas fulva]|uniref:hypothetical protein n=1 Tax=Pseudomonas fulva TaxID=47880 RepID=UPI003D9ABB64